MGFGTGVEVEGREYGDPFSLEDKIMEGWKELVVVFWKEGEWNGVD